MDPIEKFAPVRSLLMRDCLTSFVVLVDVFCAVLQGKDRIKDEFSRS
jgi:hypothetical protein